MKARRIAQQTWRVIVFYVLLSSCVQAQSTSKQIEFHIRSQRANVSLIDFAQQAGIQILFPYDVASHYYTNSVIGSYKFEDALNKLLHETGLKASINEFGGVIIQVDEKFKKNSQKKNLFTKITATIISLFKNEDKPSEFLDSSTRTTPFDAIIVTAQRREQSLQNVPISIEVFSGKDILQQGYEDLTSLQSFTPNLYLESNARNSDIMIRGVGTVGSNLGFEQAVPVFSDGVHYGRGSQITNAFLDIERIEILRGPQPVYFGQNATAGAISLTTRKPGPEWEGYIDAEYGNDNKKMVEVAAGGPISDTLGIRIAGKYFSTDGHLKNVFSGKKYPPRDSVVGRILLQWTPSEKLLVNAKAEYMEVSLGGMDEAFTLTDGVISCTQDSGTCVLEDPAAYGIVTAYPIPAEGKFTDIGMTNGPPFWEIRPEYNIRRNNLHQANLAPLVQNPPGDIENWHLGHTDFDFSPQEDIKPFVGVLDVNYTLDNDISLTSQTAYSYFDRFARITHTDNGPFATRKLDGWEEMDQYSQELRLASPSGRFIEWMGGLYWQLQNLDTRYDSLFAEIHSDYVGSHKEATSSQDSTWLSGFVTLVFNITGQLSFDIGARYTDVRKTGNIIPLGSEWLCGDALCKEDPDANIGKTPTGKTPLVRLFPEHISGEYDTNDLNWQASLRWRPTEDISLFGKYATAFKAGGFDFGKSAFSSSHAQELSFEFKDEFAWSSEIGAKASVLDGLGNVEITLFHSEFDDIQRSAFDVVAGQNRVTNAAKQSVQGSEMRGSFLLSDRWEVNVSGALLDGNMDSFPGASCTQIEIDQDLCLDVDGNPDPRGKIDRSGQEAIRSPDWSFVIGSNYWVPVMDRYKINLNGLFSYSDGFILSDTAVRIVDMPTHADLSLSLGFGSLRDTWRISFYGRHLTEPVPQYNPEFDTAPTGIATADISATMLASYGLQFQYNFR